MGVRRCRMLRCYVGLRIGLSRGGAFGAGRRGLCCLERCSSSLVLRRLLLASLQPHAQGTAKPTAAAATAATIVVRRCYIVRRVDCGGGGSGAAGCGSGGG